MIGTLIGNCVVLIAVIHGLRAVCRRLGPRAGGWALGLPSTTAVMLVLQGREHGQSSATAMAEASLLGLVAAVTLPLAYAAGVRRGWRLPAALTAAVVAYLATGSALGRLHPEGTSPRLALAFGAIAAASFLAARIGPPRARQARRHQSARGAALLRVIVPVLYVLAVDGVGKALGPQWAGLLATFPSMSVVVLAVTHLEAGPGEAARIARALPAANFSTAAFLAAFGLGCAESGLLVGAIAGYAAAFLNLAALAVFASRRRGGGLSAPPARQRWRRHRTAPLAGPGHAAASVGPTRHQSTKRHARMALRRCPGSCTVRPTSGHAPCDARRGLARSRRGPFPWPGRDHRAPRARTQCWIEYVQYQRGPPRRARFRTTGARPVTPGRRDQSRSWTGCFSGNPVAGRLVARPPPLPLTALEGVEPPCEPGHGWPLSP